jgi:hypothetical protein
MKMAYGSTTASFNPQHFIIRRDVNWSTDSFAKQTINIILPRAARRPEKPELSHIFAICPRYLERFSWDGLSYNYYNLLFICK